MNQHILTDCLSSHYETPTESAKKLEITAKLTDLYLTWCSEGRVFVIGSTRIQVALPDSDIDLLFIAPTDVSRYRFESEFFSLLCNVPWVDYSQDIFYAKVPLIKLSVEGVSIDIQFANSDEENVLDIPRYADSASLLGLLALRNTEGLIKLIPNLKRFRKLLRAVKVWGKSRGVYSSVLGFLGGLGWSLMAAKVCISYPEERTLSLLRKFFKFYYAWDWTYPVTITDELYNPSDYKGYMTVLTPCKPEINTASSVWYSGFQTIQKEIELAYKICETDSFEVLFEEIDFFQQFNLFLRINLYSTSRNSLKTLAGLFLSKLRVLLVKIEKEHPNSIVFPYAKHFATSAEGYSHGQSHFLALKFTSLSTKVSLVPSVSLFCDTISPQSPPNTAFNVSLHTRKEIDHLIRQQLIK